MRTRARAKDWNTPFCGAISTPTVAEIGNTFSRKADRFLLKVRYFYTKTPHFSPHHTVGEAFFFINTLRVHNAR